MSLPIIVLTIVFGSILLSLKLVLDYRKDRTPALGDGHRRDSGSVGTSELKRLVREAVDESVQPLARRIGDLEKALLVASGQRPAELGPGRTQPPAALPPASASSTPDSEKVTENA